MVKLKYFALQMQRTNSSDQLKMSETKLILIQVKNNSFQPLNNLERGEIFEGGGEHRLFSPATWLAYGNSILLS